MSDLENLKNNEHRPAVDANSIEANTVETVEVSVATEDNDDVSPSLLSVFDEKATPVVTRSKRSKDTPMSSLNCPINQAVEIPGFNDRMTATDNNGEMIGNETQEAYHAHAPLYLGEDQTHKSLRQFNSYGGKPLNMAIPQYGTEIKGRAALASLRRHTGFGNNITHFLPRSGIWVTMRPPLETELVDVDYKRISATTVVGRNSAGSLLGANSSVNMEILIDLALECVIDCNVSNRPDGIKEALLDRIDIMDYNKLIGLLLSTMYPDGYPWEFVCANCENIENDSAVSFARMTVTDYSVLTDKQLNMLTKHRNSITDDELAVYRNEFNLTDKGVIHLPNSDVDIEIDTCSLRDFLTYSNAWVMSIENKYAKALSGYRTEKERAVFINTQTQINRFLKYRHFIKKISWIVNEEVVSIESPEEIDEAILVLRTTNEDFRVFESIIIDYIDVNTLTVFGYEAKRCECCGFEPTNTNQRFKDVIPLAPDAIFFTLARYKTSEMNYLSTI